MPANTIYPYMKTLNARMPANYTRGFGPTRVVLLLTKIGRKSGLARVIPNVYVQVETFHPVPIAGFRPLASRPADGFPGGKCRRFRNFNLFPRPRLKG